MSLRQNVTEIAKSLFVAQLSNSQIGLLSQANPDMDIQDAYAVQAELVKCKLNAGGKIIGWKIGLTSKAMQSALNIAIPDSGVLFDDMLFKNSATIGKHRFIQPRIEAEIAFVMHRDISGKNITNDDVLNATQTIVPALEILDTRIVRRDKQTGNVRNVFDTIADNAANAGLVLGDDRFKPDEVDMRWIGAIVKCDGEVVETGLGAGVLDNPLSSVVWLVRRLAEYGGGIRAGDIVLSGSFIRPIEAKRGSKFYADFGSFGSVSCNFE